MMIPFLYHPLPLEWLLETSGIMTLRIIHLSCRYRFKSSVNDPLVILVGLSTDLKWIL